jgi:hypothetical protein
MRFAADGIRNYPLIITVVFYERIFGEQIKSIVILPISSELGVSFLFRGRLNKWSGVGVGVVGVPVSRYQVVPPRQPQLIVVQHVYGGRGERNLIVLLVHRDNGQRRYFLLVGVRPPDVYGHRRFEVLD